MLVTMANGALASLRINCVLSACAGGRGPSCTIDHDMVVHSMYREHAPDRCWCGHLESAHGSDRSSCIACMRLGESCPKFVRCMDRDEASEVRRAARNERRNRRRRLAREQRKRDLALAASVARRGALR